MLSNHSPYDAGGAWDERTPGTMSDVRITSLDEFLNGCEELAPLEDDEVDLPLDDEDDEWLARLREREADIDRRWQAEVRHRRFMGERGWGESTCLPSPYNLGSMGRPPGARPVRRRR